jgi:hypothetical protein
LNPKYIWTHLFNGKFPTPAPVLPRTPDEFVYAPPVDHTPPETGFVKNTQSKSDDVDADGYLPKMFGYDDRVAVEGTKIHVSMNALLVVEQKSKLSFDTDDGML